MVHDAIVFGSNSREVREKLLQEVSNGNEHMDQAYTEVLIGHQKIPVHFKLDTGSKVNTIPASTFEAKSLKYPLKQTNVKLQGYGGKYIKVKGQCNMKVYNRHSIIHAPRRVAFAIKDKVKVEQDRMEDLGVIAKVTKSTAWVNSLIVEKPKTGQLRICLDPKDLNQAIIRPHYRMPTFEDRRMDEIYENLDGFNVIVDDIHVHGQSTEEHDRRLRVMFKCSSEKGIHLNPEKTVIGVHEVSYFGHILSADGIKPDAKKVDAIQKMEAPKDQSDNAQIAFKKMKNAVTSTDFLAYYDPKKELTLQVHASQNGLGAAVLQEGRPVAYASKSLTQTECNYAQIEKEMYAI
ncbi:uncharacterized protein K02A2.6-like [Haliotis rufescens]|uniref:uncharacterized protein K02A2.6-like n=1 Tax=Haliotis rufescens TaxID=6454 RepID=UPI00201EB5EE|nr:uncharacterized protein K02A2.6-like [Haliotis rufescens]